MATVTSGYFDDSFKSYFNYSTDQTNTEYKITVTAAGVWQDCTWSEYNWKTVLSATNYDSRTGSVGVTRWGDGYHALITADKTYTYERKTSAYTVTIKAKSTQVSSGKNATASKTFTVPALASYKVSYNANGGSGAPSTQTKWYGKTLTLSSTKPTRSGYTFVGWGVSTTDTEKNYDPGDSFTANQNFTLYAVWKKTITLSYNSNGGGVAPASQSATVYNATTSKTFSITGITPVRTGYNFLGWSKSSSATSASYTSGDSITLSSSDTLYAVWKIKKYTIKYDANGGTNAPASQTKEYGVDLTVSSTKPTRTGYTFLGWSVPDRGYDTAYYQPGGVIEYNGNQTLVAVWKINTYAVTYDANGGKNAPASQTKTYGTDLKLSNDVPTRQYYNFKGWATSKTGSVVYSAGGTYKTNAKVTLYAVWEVAYIKPRITAVSIIRCNKDEVPQDDGVYALLNFKWKTDEPVTSIKIDRKLATAPDTSYSSGVYLDATGTSGSVIRKGGGDLSVELAYNYRITVADSTDSNDYVATLPAAVFPIDLLAGGRGVSIGEPAKEEGFVVAMDAKFKGKTSLSPVGSVHITSTNTNPASYLGGTWELIDKEFKSVYLASVPSAFTATNCSNVSCYVTRTGHTVQLRLQFDAAGTLNDSTVVIGNFVPSALGLTSLGLSFRHYSAPSDGGNAIAVLYLEGTTLECRDVIGKASDGTINSGNQITFNASWNLAYTDLLDSACDKFYWKRTA